MAKTFVLMFLLFALVAISASGTLAQTTAFSYQGTLAEGAVTRQ